MKRIYEPSNLYGDAQVGAETKIGAYSDIGGIIGRRCKIEAFAFIPRGVVIKDEVFVGPRVTFSNDKYPKAKGEWKLLKTIVKKGASIGAGAVILPGITIGEKAMVGAGAVVTKDVPAGETWVGNPARRLK